MTLTQQQIDLLKRLAEEPTGEIHLDYPHHPSAKVREELEQAGYIIVSAVNLSVLTYKITEAGRWALAEQTLV